ncbi:pleckstrin homology domain-containing family S member 1 isoform X2 [Eublepharis macularius]|nr:pleckstrin homology domain-containing family S member 1 isoform X2 [Eublepharis macularius]
MQGFFIKSPPLHLFSNQTSWKRRHFVLSKSSKDGYLLKYHKGQHKKGSIEISESSEIEIGIGDSEKMAAVKRMFKCQPTEVMTIKTEERTYYLIGTDSKEIEKWANFLFAACKEKETNTWQTPNQIATQQVSRHRSQSSPAYFNKDTSAIDTDNLHKGNENEEILVDKKRPNSDPSPQEPTEKNPIYEIPRKIGPRQRYLLSNHCVYEEQTKGKSEKEEEEESENPYYASPRSIQAELDHTIAEQNNPVKNLSSNDSDGAKSGAYMSMKKLVIKEKIQSTCTSDELVTIPRKQENSKDLIRATSTQQLTESNTRAKEFLPENKTKQLTVVQLSILLNKITDDSQLEEVDIFLPPNDAISCLTLTEAIGRICVSQWKSPHHLNCIFHHGDHITAVNDLHVTSIEEVYLFIKRSTRKEVKLTVRRLPDSETFHVKGYICREKEQGKNSS